MTLNFRIGCVKVVGSNIASCLLIMKHSAVPGYLHEICDQRDAFSMNTTVSLKSPATIGQFTDCYEHAKEATFRPVQSIRVSPFFESVTSSDTEEFTNGSNCRSRTVHTKAKDASALAEVCMRTQVWCTRTLVRAEEWEWTLVAWSTEFFWLFQTWFSWLWCWVRFPFFLFDEHMIEKCASQFGATALPQKYISIPWFLSDFSKIIIIFCACSIERHK